MEYRLGYADGELVGGSMVEALQYLKRLHTDPSSQEKYSIYFIIQTMIFTVFIP